MTKEEYLKFHIGTNQAIMVLDPTKTVPSFPKRSDCNTIVQNISDETDNSILSNPINWALLSLAFLK